MPLFEGRAVAIVGSGPGCAENPPGLIDSFDVVVRVNNYKLAAGTGRRTDVFYSFFGTSIRKSIEDLKRDGVRLCMSKLPDADISQVDGIDASWHRRNDKMIGLDYRPHYRRRASWWFCTTYVPTVAEFMAPFAALGRHMPTTGFAAIWDVLSFKPRSVYLTGFDFFRSGLHNVDERWEGSAKNADDPYRHEPERELAWVMAQVGRDPPIYKDETLLRLLKAAA